jgi:hypothetical protein
MEMATNSGSEVRRVDVDGLRSLITPIAVWLIGALVFFRRPFLSGFDGLTGDNGDARLIAVIHEHWFKVLRGEASWLSPNFFFPTKNTLGYSDTFLINQFFYVPLRGLGFDRYAAFQWTLIFLTAVGFAGFYLLVSRNTSLSRPIVLLLCLVFTFSNAMFLKLGHPQMLSLNWIPWIVVFGQRSVTASKGREAWAFTTGLLAGLVIYSAFYVGWFFFLVLPIVGLLFSILRARSIGFSPFFKSIRPKRSWVPRVITLGIGFAIMLVPFALTYLPVARKAPPKKFFEPMFYAPRPADVFNFSGSNYLWGSIARRLFNNSPRLSNGEISLALTPFLTILLIGTAVTLIALRRRGPDSPSNSSRHDLALALFITAIILRLLPVKFSFGSFWVLPWNVVPGARAIRAIDRLQVLNIFIAVLAIALALSEITRHRHDRRVLAKVLFAAQALLVLSVFEQLNVNRNNTFDRSQELRLIVVTPDPPKECRSFYLDDPSRTTPLYVLNIDAMVIASSTGLPTVNGYSGQFPPGYFPDPTQAEYRSVIQNWVAANNVGEGFCRLDRITMTWSTLAFY